jgi:5-methylcytosine-specific restriction endonuclease McrA
MTRKEEYDLYLKTERWKTLRKSALEAALQRCQVCNSDKSLQVHHRQYPKVFGQENLSFLIVLCRRCHALFHGKRTVVHHHRYKNKKEKIHARRLRREASRMAELSNIILEQRTDIDRDIINSWLK